MKPQILIITNFSLAAQNALDYACQLFDLNAYEFLLVHIYRLPLTYTIEGVALAGISETLGDIEEELNNELERARNRFPQIHVSGQYVLGGLVESSRELVAVHQPQLVLFGTSGYYSEVWHSDSELLLALKNIPVPVMIIPQHISYHGVQQIGFACDYQNICVPKQIDFIRRLLLQTKAHLNVVHVTRLQPEQDLMKQNNESLLREALHDIEPSYFSIVNPEVFKAVDQFVQEKHLDLLIVIPRRHDFWYNLFHKSNINQLAFLNRLPLLAIPG